MADLDEVRQLGFSEEFVKMWAFISATAKRLQPNVRRRHSTAANQSALPPPSDAGAGQVMKSPARTS